jgi:L-ascorbate metabolism protein UlaG (beta-lactamase superfamily)
VKLIRRTLATLLLLPAVAVLFLFTTEPKPAMLARYESNPALQTHAPAGFRGTPVDEKNRFMNLHDPYLPKWSELLRWQTEGNPDKAFKKTDTWRLPVRRDSSFLRSDEDCLVWLGHASYYIRLNGVSLLIDPVFGKLSPFTSRYAELPVPAESFRGLEYILISHDHRDHCDESSLKLLARTNPEAEYLTGLRLDGLLKKWTGTSRIQTAGWYQQYRTDSSRIEIHYLPTHHWARRGLTDTNETLWGSFILKANGRTIYFGGDTGYGPHLAQVAELFGPIDYYLAGVGAYKPEWFMGPSHMAPTDAARSAQELNARVLIPMHYGTFDLSNESLGDPQRVLEKRAEQDPALKRRLRVLAVGEVLAL